MLGVTTIILYFFPLLASSQMVNLDDFMELPSSFLSQMVNSDFMESSNLTSPCKLWLHLDSHGHHCTSINLTISDSREETVTAQLSCDDILYNSRYLEGPCDYCKVKVDVFPADATGRLIISRTVQIDEEDGWQVAREQFQDFSFQSSPYDSCPKEQPQPEPGTTVVTIGSDYVFIPDTCELEFPVPDIPNLAKLVCPPCRAASSGMCSYNIKIDGSTPHLCSTRVPITVTVFEDYSHMFNSGTGKHAPFEAYRGEFEAGLAATAPCVNFCAAKVEVYDTSCRYRVNSLSISSSNSFTATYKISTTLMPQKPTNKRNHDSVTATDCSRRWYGSKDIHGVQVYMPKHCQYDSVASRINCNCEF